MRTSDPLAARQDSLATPPLCGLWWTVKEHMGKQWHDAVATLKVKCLTKSLQLSCLWGSWIFIPNVTAVCPIAAKCQCLAATQMTNHFLGFRIRKARIRCNSVTSDPDNMTLDSGEWESMDTYQPEWTIKERDGSEKTGHFLCEPSLCLSSHCDNLMY